MNLRGAGEAYELLPAARTPLPRAVVFGEAVSHREPGRRCRWQVRYQEKENYQRLVYVPLGIHMCGLRFVPEETCGDQSERAFAFEPQTGWSEKMPSVPDGPHFQAILAALTPKDLAPPD